MAGIAILADLLRRNPSWSSQTLHSHGSFSSSLAASSAAASIAATAPFASRFLFGSAEKSVAYCDAGATLSEEDYFSSIRSASANTFRRASFQPGAKVYSIELKPFFSAFEWTSLSLTSLRSFTLFYLPLLVEPLNTDLGDDSEDSGHNAPERRVDLIVPFKKSVKQIARETSIVTTRRALERLAVHYLSQRMAWKLLKDVPQSAVRKAQRGMPTLTYFFSVTRTTFRGHLLGVAASWLVLAIIESYRVVASMLKKDGERVDRSKQVKILGKKICVTTARCAASLVFASIAAGIGAVVFQPSTGQRIGCLIGDFGGPLIVSVCFEKFLPAEYR